MVADSFYFAPTFVQGAPGQSLRLTISNRSAALHNFSIASQPVNMDIPANGMVDVTVTFPMSGVVRFYCKYHTDRGMNGQLLSGSAAPQAAP